MVGISKHSCYVDEVTLKHRLPRPKKLDVCFGKQGPEKLGSVRRFFGCIECVRCWLLLLIFVMSVCQSVCHAIQIICSVCSVRHMPRVWGHSVQPSPNALGLLFNYLFIHFYSHCACFIWYYNAADTRQTCIKCVNALYLVNTLCDNIIQLLFGANTSVTIFSQRPLKFGTAWNNRRQKTAKGTAYKKKQTKIALKQWAFLRSQKPLELVTICYGQSAFPKHTLFFVWPKHTQ